MTPDRKGISVVVCCHNGAERLPQTLRHLASQNASAAVRWEVLIVDNASTDRTVAVAEKWGKGTSVHSRIVQEGKAGLSHARHKGVLAARYDYVLFCDDDNWLDPDYVARAFRILEENQQIGILGGQSMPVSDAPELPAWFYAFCGAYAVGAQAMESGDISSRGFIWGSGMVLRANLLRSLYERGQEPLLSDRSKGRLSSGGDSEICKWYLMAGYRLWFDATLNFRHFIPATRITRQYLHGLYQGFADAAPTLRAYDAYIARDKARQAAINHPLSLLRAERIFRRLPAPQKRYFSALASNIAAATTKSEQDV